MPSPPLTTWVIMLKRLGNEKRHRTRLQARRQRPLTGDPISVIEDDGTKVTAVIVGSPRFTPPGKDSLGSYAMDADEVQTPNKRQY
jgi:hypothetical protein